MFFDDYGFDDLRLLIALSAAFRAFSVASLTSALTSIPFTEGWSSTWTLTSSVKGLSEGVSMTTSRSMTWLFLAFLNMVLLAAFSAISHMVEICSGVSSVNYRPLILFQFFPLLPSILPESSVVAPSAFPSPSLPA